MTVEQVPVWVVDDQANFRRAVVQIIAQTSGFVLAGECATGESAIELIADATRGIVLMDIHMPGMGGIEATRRLRSAHPGVAVLLMSTYELGELPADATECGALAYLPKKDLTPDLLTRVWRARQ